MTGVPIVDIIVMDEVRVKFEPNNRKFRKTVTANWCTDEGVHND